MFDGVIEVKDGRKLGYAEYGAREGYPVVLCHGTPGARFQGFAHFATRESQGFRVIVPERPGYGLSDAQQDWTLFDHVADIQTLVTHLKIQRFSVIGLSGGTPSALACAHALPHQVERVAILCGVGPLSEPELLAQCAELEQALIHGSAAGVQYVQKMVAAANHYPDAAVEQLYAGLPATDQALISKDILSVYRDMLAEGMRIPEGIVNDYRVLAKPWMFSLNEIQTPVHLWHSTDDEIVGIRHAEYLAELIPNAKLHKLSNVGHIATLFVCGLQVLEYVKTGLVANV